MLIPQTFRPALLLFASSALLAAVNGTVINRTAGTPAAGISVALVQPGQNGMRTLGSTTSDTSGHFVFDIAAPVAGPQLLQAIYHAVTYNKLLTPGSPTSNVDLDIYEATKSPAAAQVTQRWILFDAASSQLGITENIVIDNQSKTTYANDTLGAVRFYLPPAANGRVRISAQGPQGMPLPRAAEKTEQNGIYKVNFPIKPGETQIEIDYALPTGTPLVFQGRVANIPGMPAGPLRLIAPSGVTLAGKDLQSVGTEPKTQATIYNVTAPDAFSVDITGAGSLHGGDDEASSADNSDAPQVTEGQPHIYRHMSWLLVLAFSILGIGVIFLYRISPTQGPEAK